MDNNKILSVIIYFIDGSRRTIKFDKVPAEKCFFQLNNGYKYFDGNHIITFPMTSVLYADMELERKAEPVRKEQPKSLKDTIVKPIK